TLQLTLDDTGRPLADTIGVDAAVRPYLAAQAVRATGGGGRALEYLLRALQKPELGPLRSTHDVDVALRRVSEDVVSMTGVRLQVAWDGPTFETDEVPDALRQRAVQLRLVRMLARLLLLDAAFEPEASITLGSTRVRLVDAAVVLGFSYVPATSAAEAPGQAAADGGSGAGDTAAAPGTLSL